MGALEGRVVIVTGAGRGLGREHSMLFAAEGAKVVVNDLGVANDGSGEDRSPAEETAAEIRAGGGQAIANHDDVADWAGSKRLVDAAIETFGDLHVLVNNAGILRDRLLINTSEQEWDDVIRVHLRGHFLPTKWAGLYWRDQSKAGKPLKASVINTTSTSGLLSNVGQANYGAAKSGIATMTEIAQKELDRYGVRVNAIAPAARTRLTMSIPGAEDRQEERMRKAAELGFDAMDPGNVSPFVAYLATENCPIAGKTFFVYGGKVHLFQPWTMVDVIDNGLKKWTVEELAAAADKWGDVTWNQSLGIE
jgi:NAD(P)-dependent dehydrogenase (short-subunit alcohol dehydrogenase family)